MIKAIILSGALLVALSGCAGQMGEHVVLKHPKTGQIQDCTVTGHQNVVTGALGGVFAGAVTEYHVQDCRRSYEKRGFICIEGCSN